MGIPRSEGPLQPGEFPSQLDIAGQRFAGMKYIPPDAEEAESLWAGQPPVDVIDKVKKGIPKLEEDPWIKVVPKAAMAGLGGIGTGLMGVGKAGLEVAGVKTEGLDDLAKVVTEYWAPKIGNNAAKQYVSSVLQSTATSVPLMLTGPAALPLFGLTSGGNKYIQMRQEGQNILTSLTVGGVVGASEALTEKIPLKILRTKGTDIVKRLLMASAYELPGEEINTIVESIADKLTIRKDMTMDDYWKDFINTATVTIGQTVLTTGAAQLAYGKKPTGIPQPEIDPQRAAGIKIEQGLEQLRQQNAPGIPNTAPQRPATALSGVTPTQGKVKIYHGTGEQFDTFDLSKSADGTIWFTSNKSKIEKGEVSASSKGRILERVVDESKLKLAGWEETDKYSTDELIRDGYDGVKLPDGDETTYQIFFPEKLEQTSKEITSKDTPTQVPPVELQPPSKPCL